MSGEQLAATFSPDGRFLTSAGENNAATTWDTTTWTRTASERIQYNFAQN